MQKVKSIWRSLENILFLGFAISILYVTIGSFIDGSIKSFMGMGYLNNMADPIQKKIYYQSVMALLSMLTTFFLLVEIIRLFVTMNPFKNLKLKLNQLKLNLQGHPFSSQLSIIFKRIQQTTFITEFFRRYKSNFLAKVFNQYLSKLIIIFVYIEMMPFFQKFALFTVQKNWYGWLYAYLMWELSYWIWHYAAHRVRLFWCLHSPHHAPAEMNLTVAWVHFLQKDITQQPFKYLY